MTHVARGLDSDGALLLDIVVNGHILQLLTNADISLKVRTLITELIEYYIFLYFENVMLHNINFITLKYPF